MSFEAPRDGLIRSVDFDLVRDDSGGDGLTLEGYAAVFDSPTRIDSWEGQFDEVIQRGAFTKTLRERTPVLQFDHGQHPLIGSIPLGTIQSAREDDQGLYVKARLTDNWLVQPVRDAIRDGAVNGMSFRFSVVKDKWSERGKDVPLRTLLEVKAPELGPVVFPAYRDTSVGVRNRVNVGLTGDENALIEAFQRVIARAAEQYGTARGAGQQATPESAAAPTEPQSSTPRPTPEQRRLTALKIRGVI